MISFNSHNNPVKFVLLPIPILQVVKLKPRDVQQLLQGHAAGVMDLNLRTLASGTGLFTALSQPLKQAQRLEILGREGCCTKNKWRWHFICVKYSTDPAGRKERVVEINCGPLTVLYTQALWTQHWSSLVGVHTVICTLVKPSTLTGNTLLIEE